MVQSFNSRACRNKRRAIVAVPETAMDRHDGVTAPEYDVGLARQSFRVKSIPKTGPVEGAAHNKLGLCILAANPGQHPVTCFRRDSKAHRAAN